MMTSAKSNAMEREVAAETLAAAAKLGPRVTTIVTELVGVYVAESFGGRSPSRPEREGLDRLVKELRQLVGRARKRRDAPGRGAGLQKP